jgi:hypothetical protein
MGWKASETSKELVQGDSLLRDESLSTLEKGPAAKNSKGTSVPMKEKKRGSRPASTLLSNAP